MRLYQILNSSTGCLNLQTSIPRYPSASVQQIKPWPVSRLHSSILYPSDRVQTGTSHHGLVGRTSEEYLEDMLRLGKEDARTGLIPRDDCAPLGNFVRRLLARRTATQTAPPPVTLDQGDTDFVSIYTIRPGGVVASTFDCGRRIEPGQGPENHDPSNIVVLRGYPHLRSLCEVGAAYDIPTALYQRHLHYLTFNNAGSSTLSALPVLPALPAKTAIFQLTLTTIFYHGSSRLPTSRLGEVDGLRRRCADQLGSYHRDLARCEAAPGDSVVHQYSLLSDTLSAIDQTITIGIIPTSTSWTGMSVPRVPGRPQCHKGTRSKTGRRTVANR